MSPEELRILHDMKPVIYYDGNDYKFVSLQFNLEYGNFTVHINNANS